MINITIVGTQSADDSETGQLVLKTRFDDGVDERTRDMVEVMRDLLDSATDLLSKDTTEIQIYEAFGGVLSYALGSVFTYLTETDKSKEDIARMAKTIYLATVRTLGLFLQKAEDGDIEF